MGGELGERILERRQLSRKGRERPEGESVHVLDRESLALVQRLFIGPVVHPEVSHLKRAGGFGAIWRTDALKWHFLGQAGRFPGFRGEDKVKGLGLRT
jgi:hypothetical protein